MKKLLSCSICHCPILPDSTGYAGGHNAQPINDGRCCGDCNYRVVVPRRILLALERRRADELEG